MYEWRVDFYLTSGAVVSGIYVGSENDSTGVAIKLLGKDPNTLSGLFGLDRTHNLFVKVSEVVAADIYENKEKPHAND